ncbi:hypothetical protein CLAFUW4_08142 [Fulvia fulva]|uniref:Uncharacterized protein n=1 Tax=Passalora fulva TaxID=5499 RepID=A0A9Q8LCM0_PASFU|nr:uncharacterized protein CLAFUR5_08256 [Fulvia fulva]KAK4628907.1 hypothetical protein CLAFUR4_08147 [Fulvia fulva]KAK4630808.1 hypothetical protein CLAFUR0_08142 [Fulvia fulva]UJO15020.1 hypothetical protein CLAFUR5_08256 [Fulvia fulva]WPV12111.1 hypothetical protein CLAFUW4_08142 [Fulvia fulva]WPV27955.1 hypothetical protein CLAFUW7_08142 [Fulvia fulva]
MPAFAPVYTAPPSQRILLAREQKRPRKRKRGGSDEDEEDDEDGDAEDSPSSEPDTDQENAARGSQSINKKDPYHVAGWPRNKPLPGANFPHAPAKEVKSTGLSAEEELARLKPPLLLPKTTTDHQSASLKRRHLDTLTALLHKCMLNGDWHRASRAWALILRTEVQGRSIDVRQNGRWLIGGELLMRRNQAVEQQQVDARVADDSDLNLGAEQGVTTTRVPIISDDGFELARQYYERLILQHPHLQRAHHDAVNALAIYPALFNVWIYEVHDRARRARQKIHLAQETSELDMRSTSDGSEDDEVSERKRNLVQVRRTELDQASPIVQRMDELMLSPPYDTSKELLHSRGTVALWLSDLHKDISRHHSTSVENSGTSSEDETMQTESIEAQASRKRHETQAFAERRKAKTIFGQLQSAGVEVSQDIMDVLEEDEDLSANHDMD